jgi:hypothetical protein
MTGENRTITTVSYTEAIERLIKTVSNRVNFIMEENSHLDNSEMVAKWINAIDSEKRLHLLDRLDWKVSRGIEEVSGILGIKSIVEVIKAHKKIHEHGNYVVRDLGAGDGTTLKQLYQSLKKQDIIYYGTGDYIYFDLFSAIKNTKYMLTLPEEIIILFVEKVVKEFKKAGGASVIDRIKKAIANAHFSKDDTIHNSSMTNKKTLMFESEHVSSLSPEIKENFGTHLAELGELKAFVIDNIYSLFSGFFQKIYISKFNDLKIEDEVISQIDFQYSIRATSHVNGREYMKIISDYFYNSAKPGSIFIDNGIHQSYTSIPRLKELHNVSLDIIGGSFKLIYDTEKNYFCSVIITKDIEYPDSFWEPHLNPGFKLVSLGEAQRSTFFRLEYFIRNFITSNFKNSIVFWNFNSQIISTLKTIMRELEEKNTGKIFEMILGLINYIAENFQDGGVRYNTIELPVLESYVLNGENLQDILDRDIYTPAWMNINANRNY